MIRKHILGVITLILVFASSFAWSQDFPCESAKLVVPWARGVLVPEGTPGLLTRQMETIFARAVRDPEVIEALTAHGTTVKYQNRNNYRDYLADTYAEWEDIAIDVGMYRP